MRKSIYIILAICTLISCENAEVRTDTESSTRKVRPIEKAKRIKRIFYSLPSPLELTLLFKKEGVVYYGDILHDIDRRDDYLLTSKKALNLGVYGADLSYAGLFGKHQEAIEFFTVTQIIAEDLGIGQTFQKRFISRLEENANNKDTLLQVISDFFLENDVYLKDLNQQDISTYVLAGGWIEGIYLGTSMAVETSNGSGIRNIIAGQKHSLNNLTILLQNVSDNEESKWLIKSIEELEVLFNRLVDENKQNALKAEETEDGVLKISSNESETYGQDSTFIQIKEKVAVIRQKIIQ